MTLGTFITKKLSIQTEFGVTDAGAPAKKSFSVSMRTDITEEDCRHFIDRCVRVLTEGKITGAKLVEKKETKILGPMTREQEHEEEGEMSTREVQATESTTIPREEINAAPAIIGEPVKLLDMGAGVQESASTKLFYRPTTETTAEIGYVAPLSYMDIPGYAEQMSGVGF